MEIKVTHNTLLTALELVGKISTKHVTLPVLQCVRIDAKETITCAATNLEVSIMVPVVGEVITPGMVTIPAQVLLQSIQYITDTDILLRVEDGVLQIETKNATTSINTFTDEDFPTIHRVVGTESTLQAELFAYGVKSVAFAASQTSIKPELGSIFIQQKKEHSLTFVATDSFRLMEKTVAQKTFILEQSIMIPQKNALELARVAEQLGGEVACVVTETQCALRFSNGVYVASRLVTGSFPDYIQIIPKEFSTKVTVLKADLLRSFKKTAVFLNKFRQVAVTVTEQSVTISSQNSDIGHTTDTITAKVSGEEIRLNFNQQYIMDPLSYIPDDMVTLQFAGIGRALIITGASDTTLRYLVMPMNK